MVVAEEPIPEGTSLTDFIEEVRQCVFFEHSSAEHILYGGWAAVADDVIHIPVDTLQICLGLQILCLVGQFLGPPGTMVHTEQGTELFELLELFLEVGIVRFQDTVLDIMGGSTAHGKKFLAVELIYLAPHEVQNGGTYPLDLSAMPLLLGVTFVSVIVFVVPEHEGGGVWSVLQPVQSCIVPWVTMPYPTKVSIMLNSL